MLRPPLERQRTACVKSFQTAQDQRNKNRRISTEEERAQHTRGCGWEATVGVWAKNTGLRLSFSQIALPSFLDAWKTQRQQSAGT